jgi:hypothetical protein
MIYSILFFLTIPLLLASAFQEGIAYSTTTGMMTVIGKHHPRIVVTGNGDNILFCSLGRWELGCKSMLNVNLGENDLKTVDVFLPPTNRMYACYNQLHQSHLLPLCLLHNVTAASRRNNLRQSVKLSLLQWKPLTVGHRNDTRTWVSFIIFIMGVLFVILWLKH